MVNHPSTYWLDSMMVKFSDLTGTCAFRVMRPSDHYCSFYSSAFSRAVQQYVLKFEKSLVKTQEQECSFRIIYFNPLHKLGTEVGKVHFCNIPLLLNSIEAKVLMKREAVEGGNWKGQRLAKWWWPLPFIIFSPGILVPKKLINCAKNESIVPNIN